ncbi:class I SAM-dependent RNA methyltransferase, partial [Candidatus Parcubacteria bacterium]
RYSYWQDRCWAALYVKNPHFKKLNLNLPVLAGWKIFYSRPQSPAAVIDQELVAKGKDFLEEKVGDKIFRYSGTAFFQANPLAFALLLEYLKKNLSKGSVLAELYAGVGTIGIYLADKFKYLRALELEPSAQPAFYHNLAVNRCRGEFLAQSADKANLEEFLSSADVLLLDPPRSGLHPRVIRSIIKKRPPVLVYVSCNPLTQARDLELLNSAYSVGEWQLFDLYPQTPHLESVLILTKK